MLQRLQRSRNEDQPVERERLDGVRCSEEMADVRRVETAAEDADAGRTGQNWSGRGTQGRPEPTRGTAGGGVGAVAAAVVGAVTTDGPQARWTSPSAGYVRRISVHASAISSL